MSDFSLSPLFSLFLYKMEGLAHFGRSTNRLRWLNGVKNGTQFLFLKCWIIYYKRWLKEVKNGTQIVFCDVKLFITKFDVSVKRPSSDEHDEGLLIETSNFVINNLTSQKTTCVPFLPLLIIFIMRCHVELFYFSSFEIPGGHCLEVMSKWDGEAVNDEFPWYPAHNVVFIYP